MYRRRRESGAAAVAESTSPMTRPDHTTASDDAGSGGSNPLLIGIAVVSGLITLVSLGGGGGAGALLLGVALFVGGLVYFIPTFIAMSRGHGNTTAIFALNLLLGWLLIPWVGALIWALSRNTAAEAAAHQQHALPAQAAGATKVSTSETRDCPFCAEPIRKEAIKCKHCGSALERFVG
jgi:hypothetical protein